MALINQVSFRKKAINDLPQEAFQDVIALASFICSAAPTVILSFVEDERIWIKNPRPVQMSAFLQEILKPSESSTIIIADVLRQKQFDQRPFTDVGIDISFYARVPLMGSDQQILGVLHIMSPQPKILHPDQIEALEVIAKTAAERLEKEASIVEEKNSFEESSEKEKKFLDAVLENLTDGIVACDDSGRLTIFNKATREFHGLDSNKEIPAEKWAEYYKLFHGDAKTPLKIDEIPLRRAFNGEIIKDVEIVIESRNGSQRHLLCSGHAMFNKEGKKLGAVVAMRDMSAVKIANAKIEATSKMLQNLIYSCPVGIAAFDADGTIKMWNPGKEKIFGWSEKELLNCPHPYIEKKHRDHLAEVMRKVSRTREKVEERCERVRKDGKIINIHLTLLPLINDQAELYGFMSVVIDISDIKQREKNLLEANRALEAASVAKSEFLANMSHEIRTPLNGVIGLTSLVLETELKPQQQERLKLVQSSADSLLRIISDILDFSKMEAGKLEIENVPFNILEIIEEAQQTLRIFADGKDLKLTKIVDAKGPVSLLGDPGRIRQIVTNLLSNAIKFSAAGEIQTLIQVDENNGGKTHIRVEVQDQGIGIPDQVLAKLFKPFSQADSSTTRKFGGTGLGLSISKHLIELMNGEIGVESQVGKGSKFWFTLSLNPVRENALESENTKKRKFNLQSGRPRPRILLVEDNMVNQVVAREMLLIIGYEVTMAENGAAAIEALKKQTYDLILMDCQMPVMDGYEATGEIRRSPDLPNEITIIALTANAMPGDREKCLVAGMNDYIPKPLNPVVLEEMLNSYILKNEDRRVA